ncbi:hypothetical protein ACUH78_05520 [Thauera sp. ZXT1-4]|uniref:hypothetical protein n=1 Tax=Thauera sp. ZXT1-4 TaxID=3460294 RepID=UPI004040BD65
MTNALDRKAIESALDQRHDTASDLSPDALPAAAPAIWPTAGTRKADALDKRKQGGFIAPELAGWLALLAVAATLAGWR